MSPSHLKDRKESGLQFLVGIGRGYIILLKFVLNYGAGEIRTHIIYSPTFPPIQFYPEIRG